MQSTLHTPSDQQRAPNYSIVMQRTHYTRIQFSLYYHIYMVLLPQCCGTFVSYIKRYRTIDIHPHCIELILCPVNINKTREAEFYCKVKTSKFNLYLECPRITSDSRHVCFCSPGQVVVKMNVALRNSITSINKSRYELNIFTTEL